KEDEAHEQPWPPTTMTRPPRKRPRRGIQFHQIDPDTFIDILDTLRAEIDELRIRLAAHLLVCAGGEGNAARFRERLEPGGDVYASPMDVIALGDDIAQSDPDAKDHPSPSRYITLPLPLCLLYGNRAAQGINHAA